MNIKKQALRVPASLYKELLFLINALSIGFKLLL